MAIVKVTRTPVVHRMQVGPVETLRLRFQSGMPGAAGTPGARWFADAGAPAAIPAPNDGDFYLNTTNGDIYTFSGTDWSVTGTMLPGYLPLVGGILTGNLAVNVPGNALLSVTGTSAAFLRLGDSGGAANSKYADVINDGGTLLVKMLNDDTTVKHVALQIPSSGGMILGTWTTATRPAGANGMIGFNSDTQHFEVYTVGAWRILQDNLSTSHWRGTGSAVSSVDIAFPTGAKGCHIRGSWSPVTSTANLVLRTSTNGGSSFDAGAADYKYGSSLRTGNTRGEGADANTAFVLVGAVPNGTDPFPFQVTVHLSQGAGYTTIQAKSAGYSGAQTTDLDVVGFRQATTTPNAVRLLATTGNLTTINYTVEFL